MEKMYFAGPLCSAPISDASGEVCVGDPWGQNIRRIPIQPNWCP